MLKLMKVSPIAVLLAALLIVLPFVSYAGDTPQPPGNLLAFRLIKQLREESEGKSKPEQQQPQQQDSQKQTDSQPQPQPGEQSPPAPQPLYQAQPGPSDSVNFFFDDADVFEVVQTVFGDILKLNYMISPSVKGRVNFRTVTPIPKSEVLGVMEIILRINGVGFVEENGIYRILPISEVPNELMYAQVSKDPAAAAVEMFTFRNLSIKDSMKELQVLLGAAVGSGAIRVVPVERLNAVIIAAASKDEMVLAKKWLANLEDMFKSAKTRIYVHPLQNSKAKHIGGILQELLGGQTGSRTTAPQATEPSQPSQQQQDKDKKSSETPSISKASVITAGSSQLAADTRILADEITNSLIIMATPSDYEFLAGTINRLDTLPRQVLIEVLVAEVTLSNDLKFGIEWFLNNKFRAGDTDLFGTVQFNSPNVSQGSGFTFTALDTANAVRGLLQTLASDSKLNVIASPHIMASDNMEAHIQIGSQVPTVTSEISTTVQTGGNTGVQRNIQYRDTGVILTVKPQINEGGLVSLDLTQEVSDVREALTEGVQSPVIFKREASTNLVVQDGRTVVIGGLIQDRDQRLKEGIPFLSKIPILGYLFGYTLKKTERTELIVMITPHVVKSPSDAERTSKDLIEKMEGIDIGGDKKGAGPAGRN